MVLKPQQLNSLYKGKQVRVFITPKEMVEGLFLGVWNDQCVLLNCDQFQSKMLTVPVSKLFIVLPVKKYVPGEKENVFRLFYSSTN